MVILYVCSYRETPAGDISKADRHRGGCLGRRAIRQLPALAGGNSRQFPSKREFSLFVSKTAVSAPRNEKPINPLPGNFRCRRNGNLFTPNRELNTPNRE
jgi:hypothetical protein